MSQPAVHGRRVPVTIHRAAGRARRRVRRPPHSGCYAPMVQLYFFPDGEVRPCCLNTAFPLGNVRDERLLDIWHGARRRQLVDRLAGDDFTLGCETCAWELQVEGRDTSMPGHFDRKAGHLTANPATSAWPRWMEFNLSNACNLQCIQCNGDLSSSIRIHREGRPALAKAYGDEFFEDLGHFLPHLTHAQFAGGEPFMASENYRVWDLVAEVAPHVRCSVVTNATQWNRRVERVLEQLPLSFCFSLDGITKGTYEAIRVGADLDEVLVNLDRFCDYAHRVGTELYWNFCLMPQNVHEFGDVLRFAEQRDIQVNVQVVHVPSSASLAALPPDDLAEVLERLEAESASVLGDLRRNAGAWRAELRRIRSWVAAADPEAHADAWGGGPTVAPPVDPPVPRVLGLPGQGQGPVDASDAERTLARFSRDGVAHHVVVDAAGAITSCSPDAGHALGVTSGSLVGQPAEALQRAAEDRYGARTSFEVLGESDDCLDACGVYGAQEFRMAIVALRDASGFADHAAVVFAFRPLEPVR